MTILSERRRGEHERNDEGEGALRHTELLSNSVARVIDHIFSGKSQASM